MSEVERTLLIADLSGYTALTETHGAMHAADFVLRFNRMAEASLEPGVAIVDRVGDQVLCAGDHSDAMLRCALRLCAAVEKEPGFLSVRGAALWRAAQPDGEACLARARRPDPVHCASGR